MCWTIKTHGSHTNLSQGETVRFVLHLGVAHMNIGGVMKININMTKHQVPVDFT